MARFQQKEFASIQLTVADEKQFTEWITSENQSGLDIMNKLSGDGFKMSLSYIFDQSAFCFSIIGTENTKKHADLVMSSWSDDLEEAILIGAYKHYVLCQEDVWPTAKSGQRWG